MSALRASSGEVSGVRATIGAVTSWSSISTHRPASSARLATTSSVARHTICATCSGTLSSRARGSRQRRVRSASARSSRLAAGSRPVTMRNATAPSAKTSASIVRSAESLLSSGAWYSAQASAARSVAWLVPVTESPLPSWKL
jgi:hypothetical protein